MAPVLNGALPREQRAEIFGKLKPAEARRLLHSRKWRAGPSSGRRKGDWRTWLILAGRGYDKTRTGAETIIQWVRQGARQLHLVARRAADYRDSMILGESGLLACSPPDFRPD